MIMNSARKMADGRRSRVVMFGQDVLNYGAIACRVKPNTPFLNHVITNMQLRSGEHTTKRAINSSDDLINVVFLGDQRRRET